MKVSELVNSCQNQWKGLFGQNGDFKIVFIFYECENIETWTIDEFNYFHCEGLSNESIFNRIYKRHSQNVMSWKMVDLNTIQIQVRQF